MKGKSTAEIEWLPKDAGGRQSPPPGPEYMAPARFEDDAESWPDGAWTLVARLERARDPYHWTATVGFLMDDAPHHRLKGGARFEFYEGSRCVARGTVIGADPRKDDERAR